MGKVPVNSITQEHMQQRAEWVCGNCLTPAWRVRSDSDTATRIESSSPAWLPAVEERLRGFLGLPENWNGYGEKRISRRAVNGALGLLNSLGPHIAKPIASPLPDGGVQMEWIRNRSELEVEVRDGMPLALFFIDADGNETDQDDASREELRLCLAAMGYQTP